MKKIIIFLLFTVIFIFSCKEPITPIATKRSQREIVMYPVNDSINDIFVFAHVFEDQVVLDSVSGIKTVKTVERWGKPIVKVVIDSLTNKPKLDAQGNVIPYISGYDYKGTIDSLVIWNIQGKDFDSLTKRKKH